ncbi:MAG: SdrD B-like domain-containing protein [Spirosomataceae bacterium]
MKTVYPNLRNFVHPPVTKSFHKWLFTVGVMLMVAISANAQITGTVYRDFNANGTKDGSAEIGVGGVTVTAYRSDGAVAATGTTSTASATIGQYSLTVSGSSAYRIEFSNFPTGYFSGPKGSGSATSVQFVTGNTGTASLGINYPADYCQNNPQVAIPCYVNGDPLLNISDDTKEAGLVEVLVSFPYNSTGTTAPSKMAKGNQMGAVWGLAYQKESNTLYSGALMKRHVGFGPGGPGAIYKTTNANATSGFANSVFFKLSDYGIDAGADPHVGLTGNKAVSSSDNAAFDAVGRVGIGDIDLSEDGKTLFVVNLKDKKLYSFLIGSPGVAPANENAADQAGNIRSYTIPNPQCSNSEYIPWGLKFFHGKLYVGVVCTAQTSQNKADLKATVYEFDPATGAFTNVLVDNSNNAAFSLNFKRGSVFCNDTDAKAQADWRPWRTSNVVVPTDGFTDAQSCTGGALVTYAQPILSDIEFDADGSMVIAFADRFGNQSGRENEDKNGTLFSGFSQGDILRAGPVQNGWKIENNGTANGVTGGGSGNAEGPGGGEFYGGSRNSGGDYAPTGDEAIDHAQAAQGGIGLRLGSGEVMTNLIDPSYAGTQTYWSGGIRRLSNTTGLKNNDDYKLYDGTDQLTGALGKANGLGDIEVLCGLAPVEIGNRVWNDGDGDGIQDAGELGINGVTVLLFKKDANGNFTSQVATQTTSGNGEYYFTNLDINTDYQVRVLTGQNPLSGLNLTQANAGSNDAIDSDATLDNNLSAAVIVLKTGGYGENNHTYDLGFNNCPTVQATGSAVCVGGTVSLSASGTNISTYSWSGPATFTATIANPTRTGATTAMSGTYSVTVANAGGCKVTATVTATVYPNPTVTASSNTPVCAGNNIELTASGGDSYSWAGPNLFTSTSAKPIRTNATAAMVGTYSVSVTGANSCTASATTSVTVNAKPSISTQSFTACEGGTINISASATGATAYSWAGPGGFSSTQQAPTRANATTDMAGTYTVTVTNSTSCTNTATATVAVTPAPVIAPKEIAFCPGGSVTLSASGGTTYSWNTGETTPSITVTKAGTYTVTIRNQDGCIASASFIVTESPKPVINPSSNSPICAGSTITLSASGGGTYLWAGPANFTSALSNPTRTNATTSMQGVYSVVVTGTNSCTASATTSVVVNQTTATASASSPVCIGSTITLSSTGGGTYSWAGPANFASTAQNPTRTGATTDMAGTYTVTVVKNSCSATATTSVVVNTQGAQASSNFPICTGGNINLSATAGASYSWAGPSAFTATIQNPTRSNATSAMSGVYSVTVQGQNSCSGTATVSVTVNPKPNATATSNSPVCLGGAINLSAAGGTTYSWKGPLAYASTEQFPVLPNATTDMGGVYSVTVTDANECTNTATTSVVVNVTTPTASSNSPICAGSTIQLSASGGGTYQWSGPAGFTASTQNPTRTNATTAMGGTYTVTVTKNNCPATATVSLVINTQGATAAANTPVCEGTSINLSASLGSAYSWTGPGGFTSTDRNPVRPNATSTMGGVYFVTVLGANNSCTGVASVSVVINPKPQPVIESNSPVCLGGSISLSASGGDTYSWAGPANFSSTLAAPERTNATTGMAGTYTVTVTDENKCTATATASVQIITVTPKVSANSPVCVGSSIKLSASGGATYSWSGPDDFTSDQQNPVIDAATTDSEGTYTVTVYSREQCSATATVNVKINTQGATASSNSPVCDGTTINLSASSGGTGATYSWAGPANFSSSIQNPTRANATSSMAGVYTVTVSGKEGCTGTATTSVVVSPKPSATASSNTPVCEKSPLTLSATGGVSYSWAGPANFSSTLQNPSRPEATTAMSGVYSVTVKSETGCTNVATTSVSVKALPSFDADAISPTCKDKEVQDNGQLVIKNLKNGTRVGYSLGATYNGPNYNGATSIPSNGIIVSNLVNPTDEEVYTIRIFNGSNDCYTDVQVTLKPGNCQFGSIGDYVWKDLNKNGLQDKGEPAVSGVKVELYASNASGLPQGAALETTETDADGKYLFDSLETGDYVVKFIIPTGMDMTFTTPTQGNDKTVDSDANTSTGLSGKVSIDVNGTGIAKDNPTIDAGLVNNYGSIGDFVWKDLNKNGIQDKNEPAVPGVGVELYTANANGQPQGAALKTTTTDANGKYLFDSLASGDYVVKFIIPSGMDMKFTSPNQGNDKTIDSDANTSTGLSGKVTINANGTGIAKDNPTIDAGLVTNYGSIGDYVWKDLNKDGTQDKDEPAVSGVGVELYAANANGQPQGAALKTTTTDANGKYLFDSLASGDYVVKFIIPSGMNMKFTSPNQGNDKTIDSDANTSTGLSGKVTIDVNGTGIAKDNPTIDAGLVTNFGSIGDFVWKDLNKNGLQDKGEPGVANITVELYAANANGQPQGAALKTTITDANGKYLFDSLASGDYVVKFILTKGMNMSFTESTKGSDTSIDSDANTSTGLSGKITIDVNGTGNAKDNKTIDAGLIFDFGSIGDYVWKDINKNGLQDNTEAGVAGVKVILYQKIETQFVKVDSTITDANGKYLFDSLITGTYKVKFDISNQPDCIYTKKDAGDDTKDSDADTDGFSPEIKIDTTLPENNIGRNNLTVDAGLIFKCVKPEISVFPDQILCEGDPVKPFNVAEPNNPTDLTVQWYGYEASTTLGVKLAGVTSGSFTPSGEFLVPADGKTYYYGVVAVRGDKNCADTAFVALTINPKPIVEATSNKASICVGDSAILSAKTNIKNAVINWYTDAKGGVPFATTKNGETVAVAPIKTTTYYAEAVSREGCVSVRVPVTIVVNAKPAEPTCSGNTTNSCPATTVDLTKLQISPLSIPGGKFEWHTGESPSSPLVKDPSKVGKGNYYLFEKSPAGCYSDPSLVVVNIIKCTCQDPPMVMAGDDQKVCAGDTIRLKGSFGGTAAGAIWSSPTGGTFGNPKSLITYYVPSAQDIVKGKVTITLTTIDNDPDDACEPVSDALMVTICPLPKTPYNLTCSDSVLCRGMGTKLIAVSPGAKIRWYSAETGGTLLGVVDSGVGFPVSPTTTTTYWAEAVSLEGCTSPMRSPIVVKVKKCYADLAVEKKVLTPGKYKVGQEITYSLVASNNGPVHADSVQVIDKLPASLTFVSSVPPSEYNSTTGVWNIGKLTVGSTKVLEIKAKINAMALITNLAYITSPDNDLTKTYNDTSSVTINSIEKSDLSLTKAVSKATALTGDTLTYTITVSNAGPDAATNVKVKDHLPANLKFIASSSFVESSGDLLAKVAKIDSGASVALTFTAKIIEEGTIVNCAEVYSLDQLDPDSKPGNGTGKEEDDEDCATTTAKDPCNAKPPVLSCTDCLNICAGQKVVLYADGCEGTVEWSTGDTGPSIVVTPTVTTSYSAVCVLTKKCRSEKVEVTIKVGNPKAPVVTCSDPAICYGGKVNLTAAGCTGELIWSNGYSGSVITVKPKETTTFFAYCKVGNCLSPKSNEQTVTVTPPIAKPTTTDLVNDCPSQTVDLFLGVLSNPVTKGGVFEFHTGTEPTSPLVANPKKVTQSGTYYVFEKSVIGCYSEVCNIHVLITDCNPVPPCATNPATADAGPDATICADKTYKLTGKIGGAATSAKWSTSGKGTFDNPLQLGATYTASAEDVAAGYVWLKLTTNDPDGSGKDCQAAADSMKLTIKVLKDKPYVTILGSLHLCYGDSVKLTAQPSGYRYSWNTGDTTRVLYIKKTGTFNVRLVDAIGCVSLECEPIDVKVEEPVPTPVCSNKAANSCPDKTVDLTKIVTSKPATVGGVFEFHTGSQPTSPILVNPTAVSQSGTYYLFEKSGSGCYSKPMAITVTIIACETPHGADLSLTKKVSVAQALVGTEIVYQLTVRNLGPDTAKNVVITDQLPVGVQYLYSTGATPSQYDNGTVKASFTQLAKGDSARVSFIVKVAQVGNIVNTATVKSSSEDANTDNNTSSVVFKGFVKDTVVSINATIGLAKSVASVSKHSDDEHDVVYRFVLRHYGNANVNYVQIVDSLKNTFPADSGVTFEVIEKPKANANSKLKVNPDFNGSTDVRLVIGDESSILKASSADTISFTVRVKAANQTKPFLNSAYVTAKANGLSVSDVSTDGLNPDPNNNGNPSDANESEPTPLLLSITGADNVFIPEGFSPNGDGINDAFVIRNVPGELTIQLQVYNIWGVLVYSNDEYKNDWTGNANIGKSIGSPAGLPDGTYYYLVQLSDGRRYIRFFTLSR